MEYIVLRRYYNLTEAEIVLSRLQVNDINCFLTNTNTANLLWNMSIAHGGVELMLHKNDYQKAIDIIEDKVENLITSEKCSIQICPKCGSNNVRFGSNSNSINWWQLLMLIFVAGPAPIKGNAYHCFNCANRFR